MLNILEILIFKKYRTIVFKKSDLNLDLSEREAKLKDYYGRIFCGRCNTKFENNVLYCKFCYMLETNDEERNRILYGKCKICSQICTSPSCSSCIVFKELDYDLDLNRRKAKFKDYNLIFCGKCKKKFDGYCNYCYYCYDKETNGEEKYRMQYGKCKKCSQLRKNHDRCLTCGESDNEKDIYFLKISDYDLALHERKTKFENFSGLLLCEKCNQITIRRITGFSRYFNNDAEFHCYDCYYVETDKKERNRMLYGRCKKCLQIRKSLDCLSCKIIFKNSDYDLDLNEREEKSKDYDSILCEKCNIKFESYVFYCKYCYKKETNEEERNRILYGKCKICSQIRTSPSCSSCIVFKKLDYDLSLDERVAKFENYVNISCEKCRRKVNMDLLRCNYCYGKETNKKEKNRMLYGRCKKCLQIRASPECLTSCSVIFKNSDYDLELDERREKFKDCDMISCEKCKRLVEISLFYCNHCYDKEINEKEKNRMLLGKCNECSRELHICISCRFRQNFKNWTSGDKNIDELIQGTQVFARDLYGILEWIPYDRFININYIAKGGFAKVYSATWKDGYIIGCSKESNEWKRKGSLKVALKVLNDSSINISDDFLNEVRSLKKFPNINSGIVEFYGITQDFATNNYALVFKLEDSSLHSYLYQNKLILKRKLYIIKNICSGLRCIHSYGLVHKDLHTGNILHSFLEKQSYTCIGDFGFCKPANENSSESRIYGVMPYMAPEILRGKPHTKESDIYSLGIIINEIISRILPFDEPHDYLLALDICRGRRPKISKETPEFLRKLIEKCWDANPENRPSSDEIDDFIRTGVHLFIDYEESEELYISPETQLFKSHPASRLLNLPNLPEPVNCQNQEEFVSSRSIIQVQTGEVTTPNSEGLNDCAIVD